MEVEPLIHFLKTKTRAYELCVIRENGWIIATCWVDSEDLFLIPNSLYDKFVKSHAWGYLPIVNENGAKIKVPCHYIDL